MVTQATITEEMATISNILLQNSVRSTANTLNLTTELKFDSLPSYL